MKKRITVSLNYSLALLLIFVLGFSPSLSLAVGRSNRRSIRIPRTMRVSFAKSRKPSATARVRRSVQLIGRSATLLPDGRTLLLGGEGQGGPQATALIRDERTGATTPLPKEMHRARAWHSATVLPDGRVLILGGLDANNQVVNGAEVFDPEAQTFELLPVPSLSPRAYHTATLLTDGRVLIVGGVSDKKQPLGQAELWDLKTKTATAVPGKLSRSAAEAPCDADARWQRADRGWSGW